MKLLLFLIIVVTFLLPAFRACVKSPGNKYPQGVWDDKTTPRNNIVETCECGRHENFVFISWSSAGSTFPNSQKPCWGMIVTSNMIATSHKCMRLNGTQIQPYDAWSPRPNKTKFDKVFPSESEIIVSTSHWSPSNGKNFTVERLIVNPHFATYAPVDDDNDDHPFSGNDLLLLVLQADFTEDGEAPQLQWHPICIPPSDPHFDLTGQQGILVGLNELHLDSEPLIVYEAVVPGTGIRYGTDCGERKESWVSTLDRKMDRQLCVRYNSGDSCLIPTDEGNVLLSNTYPPFLLGIVTNHVSPEPGVGFLHLTNIFPLVKYLEYHANLAGSKWCTTPQFSLGDKVDPKIPSPSSISEKSLCGSWPWTNFTPPPRDMSLDCECGRLNSGASTMIIGGTTATPREFGWMAKLRIVWKDDDGQLLGSARCGGSVINDRMILTAAHCFAWSTYGRLGSRQYAVSLPEDATVFLNAHEREDDPLEIPVFLKAVHIHYGYIGAKRKIGKGQTIDDIAVLVLKTPLSFVPSSSPSGDGNNGLRPVCLHTFEDNPPPVWIGKNATVAGWGYTSKGEDRKLAEQLQKLDVPIQEISVCREAAVPFKISEGYLCAGTLDPNKNSAGGDSGGPLMVNEGGGGNETSYKYFLAGVVSHGVGSASMYTDVHKMIRFVDYFATQVGAKWCKS